MADKDKKENAINDEVVPATKPKKAAPPQEDPQDDDDEQKEEEKRLRQEKVKKRKEEMRRKAEQRRKQEQEEEDDVEDEAPSKAQKSKPAATKNPIRENVVNNSVMFLNHPKVKSAPLSQKIAYFQKKGLTPEEIQETLERAGESVGSANTGYSPSAPSATQSYNNPAIPPRPSNYYGPQVPPQAYPPYPQQQIIPAPPPQQPWYGGKLGFAVTIASCVGIGMGFSYIAKNYISPWLFNNREKDNETKQREEYQTKVFEEMLQSLKTMQQSNTELKDYMKTQGELKDLVKTALETKNTAPSLSQSGARDLERIKIAELEAELKKMKAQLVDAKSLQTASTSSYQSWNPTESKIPAWQRSVSASSAPSVNTNTPTQPQNVDSFKSPAKEGPSTPTSSTSPDPVPQSYTQILEMVRNGQLPDDIKDIDDKPREPFAPIEKGERESRPKPWMKKGTDTAPASSTPTTTTVAPAAAEQANGQAQAETKPASTEAKPTEEIVS
mmetsp:Transcript_12506/g.17329  ORF Transcript_12506/g.17329 Transcript_12506/m.17329 type:complete len:498 (-) Transcript_12506:659-2152(-)